MAAPSGSTSVGAVHYDVALDTSRMIAAEREIKSRLDSVAGHGERLQASMTKVAAGITAALSAIAVDGLVSKLIQVQRQFDVLFSSLKTVTGGATQATAAWERLQQFAQTTPFTLDQAVQGFVRLRSLGLSASERAMTSFGNTASAMGKDLMQMIEAVADASTGEFERLKEFGIKAKTEGDKVIFTFQGVSTTVKNSASAITEYLTAIGESKFAGAMSERMKTLDGDISNLNDSIDGLFRTISSSGIGDQIANGVRILTNAVQELSNSVKDGELTDYFSGLREVLQALEVVGVSVAGAFAGKLALAMQEAVVAVLAKAAASREAAAAELMRLKAAESAAFADAQSAASARASALAEAERAAAVVASTRANVALLATHAKQAEANAALLAGTSAYYQAKAVERTITTQLTAAKAAEAEATAALTVAERALAAARGQAISTATAATASTVALSAAQNAAASASALAAGASRTFSGVIAALGGPIGIAVTALALLALNWDSVAGKARDAATISEESADRIAAALRKSPLKAGADLQAQLAETLDELKGIDQELARTGANMASDADLNELRRRRAVLVGVASDIRAAMDKLHGGAGRGKVNPPLAEPSAPDSPATPKEAKFDSAGYLAKLEQATADGVERVNLIEQEALRKNAELLNQGKINREQAARAAALIEANAAQERMAIQLSSAEEQRALIEQQGRQEVEQTRRLAEEQARSRQLAETTIAGSDPVQAVILEAQRKSEALKEAALRDQENERLYAEARVALEQQTADRIAEITQQRADKQAAANSAMLQNYGSLFGNLADASKAFASEQSGIYRVMFAASKAFAIADSIVKIQQGIANSLALPFPANIAAAATTAATAAGLISTIRGTNYGGGRQYGGPTTAGTMYRVNETGRPEMFTASNGAQYMLPTTNGSVTPADQVGGGVSIKVELINTGTPQQVQSQSYDSDERVLRLVTADIVSQIEGNSGPVFNALKRSTNVQGRL